MATKYTVYLLASIILPLLSLVTELAGFQKLNLMQTTQRGILAIAAILGVITLIGYSSHGQSDTQPTADDILQPVAPADLPDDATFFYLSEYLDNGGSLGAPWPFLKRTNGAIYALNTDGPFLVDDPP